MALTELDDMELYRGEQAVWDIDTDTDLTGATLYFAVYATYPAGSVDDDTGALISKTSGSGMAFTDASEGQFTITVDSADTEDWELGQDPTNYVYGIEYQPAGQTYRLSIGRGKFAVYYDVVRA
jgi:hypothetical protein